MLTILAVKEDLVGGVALTGHCCIYSIEVSIPSFILKEFQWQAEYSS